MSEKAASDRPISLPITLVKRFGSLSALVAGAGSVGTRKVKRLVQAGASVRWVDPDPKAGEFIHPRVTRLIDRVQPEHFRGIAIVVACTNDPLVNASIIGEGQANRCLTCDAIHPERGDFTFPSLVQRGRLQIAVSTDGASPSLSAELKQRLDGQYDDAYGTLTELLWELRETVLKDVDDSALRSAILRKLGGTAYLNHLRIYGEWATRTALRIEMAKMVAASVNR